MVRSQGVLILSVNTVCEIGMTTKILWQTGIGKQCRPRSDAAERGV